MFRAFARLLGTRPESVFLFHPADLEAVLELAWDRRLDLNATLGGPFHRSDLNRFQDTWIGSRALAGSAPWPPSPPRPLQPNLNILIGAIPLARDVNRVSWNHLIYAYMIQNTRVDSILRRVVQEFTHGEKLGVATRETQHWLRNAEELLYRDHLPLSVGALTSSCRPEFDAIQRTSFYRLLGMDLNHGGTDNKPYPYVRPEAANTELANTLEELLREAWIGMINASNSSGPKATDNAKLVDLIKQLEAMLMTRRLYGTLSREEFAAVCRAEFLHQTLDSDSPVVKDMRAEGFSPEERLYKIAQKVGSPAHGLAGSYFKIAEPISRLLIMIETGIFSTVPNAAIALYTPGPMADLVRTIVTHWSVITGRDIKGGKVAPNDGLRATAARTSQLTNVPGGSGMNPSPAPTVPVPERVLAAARNGSSSS